MNVVSESHISSAPHLLWQDRRTTSRFPLAEEITYKFRHGKVVGAGAGRCVNIGSGGLLFATKNPPPVGRTIELSLNWPALLDGACALKFIATGPVVRVGENQAAMRIDRYEFRTRAMRPGLATSIQELRAL